MRRSSRIALVLIGVAGVTAYGLRQGALRQSEGSLDPANPGSDTNATHTSCARSTGRSSTYYHPSPSSHRGGSSGGSSVSTHTSRGGFGHSAHFSGG